MTWGCLIYSLPVWMGKLRPKRWCGFDIQGLDLKVGNQADTERRRGGPHRPAREIRPKQKRHLSGHSTQKPWFPLCFPGANHHLHFCLQHPTSLPPSLRRPPPTHRCHPHVTPQFIAQGPQETGTPDLTSKTVPTDRGKVECHPGVCPGVHGSPAVKLGLQPAQSSRVQVGCRPW